MSRTLNVVRMQLANRQTFIWIPIIILISSFVLSLAIVGILSSSGIDEDKFGYGIQAPLWYFLFTGIYALTLSFPFSQAMSVTRREFWAGTLLTAVLTALILGVVVVVGGLLEQATNGWGINGYFFYLPWIWESGPLVAGVFWIVMTFLVFVVGFGAATLYKRFGPLGLTIVLLSLGVLLVGGMFVIGRTDSWLRVFTWIAEQGPLGFSLWGLLVAAVVSASAYGLLRRAVP